MISKELQKQINEKGINATQIKQQISQFEQGSSPVDLAAPALKENNGIKILSQAEEQKIVQRYEEKAKQLNLLKFVPASGAASRMFKDLYSFLDTGEWNAVIQEFFDNLEKFAFYPALQQITSSEKPDAIIKNLLSEEGLNYGFLPKALLLFHNYKEEKRTAFEEHLAEGAKYACGKNNEVHIHFTVSKEHLEMFKQLVKKVQPVYEEKHQCLYKISFSVQKESTDTLAVDLNNEPFIADDGKFLFRPGGHGALIENLNEQKADIIFIKNIDNVVPDTLKMQTIHYKKVLGGLLIEIQEQIFSYIKLINNRTYTKENLLEIQRFIQTNLGFKKTNATLFSPEEMLQILERPLRICGMVKNEGEPGGGPFWVKDKNGNLSLQIIESAQINRNNAQQEQILQSSTHFNPVDIVCSFKKYDGAYYDLTDFIDPETSFIANKTYNGRKLKALELPGLWNGAMAHWNTMFVEVPLITFNPVKTIFDLLRKEHQ